MKIGLVDVDSRHFPNFALMKLSAWHKAQGDTVEWWNGFTHYDRVYLSKVFTFTPDHDTVIDADEIVTGGTGYKDYGTLPPEVEKMFPDYSIYPQYHQAIGFLTRGCCRSCEWCIVPRKEGAIRPAATWEQVKRPDSREMILMDNNVLPGYSIDPAGQIQTVEVNPDDTQYVTFYNSPSGNFELIKVVAGNKEKRIPDVTFEIRRADDDALVDTIITDSEGRATLQLDAGNYYAVETQCPKEYKLDSTRHTFNVKDGKNTTLTVENKAFSGILIHKTDSVTGEGLYGVDFLLYDSANRPVGQYTSDDQGYVHIEDLTDGGRYYLRELENEGYIPDTQRKTVYVKAGEVTLIEWQNTPITGQIQIKKTSEDYNSMNGWPAGTPIPGTEFEIYHYRTGNLVDTVRTDKNGVAVSKPLPLGRYQIVESKAADHYGLDKTPIEAEIEHAGQIVKVAMTNKALSTNVSIKKTGYAEVMPGQGIRYTFSEIGNNSTTALTSFYWRDSLPTQAVRLYKIFTGTYNAAGNYKVVYKTNLSNGEYRTMYDNLSTAKNHTLDASPTALGLASNEYVTEFMLVFGVVPANFRQVEAPKVDCKVLNTVKGGSSFTNTADVGGVYNGQWIQAVTRWTTKVYGKPIIPTLPKTGY